MKILKQYNEPSESQTDYQGSHHNNSFEKLTEFSKIEEELYSTFDFSKD